VTRRFKRLMEEGGAFPDLLLVDGGKGQLSSATEALAALGIPDQPAIGLAKRLEEVFVPNSPDPQNIPRTSSALKLLQAVRDEAHRFAVTYHRTLRARRQTLSVLDEIEDVGPARKRALLQKFGSVRRIAEADAAEVAAVEGIGKRLAERIREHLNTRETADVIQNNQHRMRYDITLLNAHGIRQRGHFTANVLFNGHVPQGFNDLPVDLR